MREKSEQQFRVRTVFVRKRTVRADFSLRDAHENSDAIARIRKFVWVRVSLCEAMDTNWRPAACPLRRAFVDTLWPLLDNRST